MIDALARRNAICAGVLQVVRFALLFGIIVLQPTSFSTYCVMHKGCKKEQGQCFGFCAADFQSGLVKS